MAVEICVSADELKQTLEYMSLISGAGGIKSKKKDKNDKNNDLNQLSGTVKITAVSPRKDKSYLLMFECLGAASQLLYRMEGKSYNSADAAITYVEGWRLAALVKTFSGDVTLRFEGTYLGVSCGNSHYKITKVQLELPAMNIPGDIKPFVLSVKFLQETVRHCSVACGHETARPIFNCIQINLQHDGKAVCYATDTHRLARYVDSNSGSKADAVLLMLPAAIQHIVEMCDCNEVQIIPTDRCIYARTARFDYQVYAVIGKMPDCAKIFNQFKALKNVTVNKQKLLGAVTRAGVMNDDINDGRIRFASNNESFFIESACVGGSGLDNIPLESVAGTDDKLYNVSAISFSKILSSCASESISISTQGQLKPLLISAPDSENSFILAPMR